MEKDNLWGDLDELEVGVSPHSEQAPVGEEVAVYSEVGEEVVEWSPEVSESPTFDLEEVGGENIDLEEKFDTEQIGASESISDLDELEVAIVAIKASLGEEVNNATEVFE